MFGVGVEYFKWDSEAFCNIKEDVCDIPVTKCSSTMITASWNMLSVLLVRVQSAVNLHRMKGCFCEEGTF